MGQPIYKLMGTEPATKERRASTADLARVPPFDRSLLLNTDFRTATPLMNAAGPSRPKGWRGFPLLESEMDDRLGTRLDAGNWGIIAAALSNSKSEIPDLKSEISNSGSLLASSPIIGFGLGGGKAALTLKKGDAALLAQEVRSPFAGTFVLKARLSGGGCSKEFYDGVFAKNFTVKLQFYQYTDAAKSPLQRRELGSLTVQPPYAEPGGKVEEYTLEKVFENPSAGANFSFGLGMGVAVIIEKTSDAPLELPADCPNRAHIRVHELTLDFAGKKRKEDVVV
jgi:hypothetical protein